MFNEITKSVMWNGQVLEISTGKIARQANAAVTVKMGNSILLCTCVVANKVKDGIGFFPLTINYREMAYSAGKIPGGFFKREGKASDREILVSRLIDRPIRPLFHQAFMHETHVTCSVLSYDPATPVDILAIIGASAALSISPAPYLEIVAASKVGLINGEFVLNPTLELLKTSQLDLVVAGTEDSVMMVESEAHLLSEDKMLEAVKFGFESFQTVIKLIKELAKEAKKPKFEMQDLYPSSLKKEIEKLFTKEVEQAFEIKSKQERSTDLALIYEKVLTHFVRDIENKKYNNYQIESALKAISADILRNKILEKNIRIDGRSTTDIRQIACEVGLLPSAHGSALFTRGETQSLVSTTFGTSLDEQIVDSLEGEYKERFMLNYIFPPYSVNEAMPMKAPSRREVGHGKLAWRAINPILPNKVQFPYSIRVVAETTESNGSSSMATVCGSSLALMHAGVPIKAPVAGIAMGLVKESNKFAVLSDIIGDEDYFGDMDFKVAGTSQGITALQMDIKISGIDFKIIQIALEQARLGRLHILEQMNKVISKPNSELSKNAPSSTTVKIDKDKIKDIIGPGGKIIKEICETSNAKIDISDDGTVSIYASDRDKIKIALDKIKAIAVEPEIGEIFNGTVMKVLDSGAFINYLGNKDGFVHISEISDARIDKVSSVLKQGDIVKVKLIGFDNKGKAKLTIKNAYKDHSSNNTKQKNNVKDDSESEQRRDTSKKRTWNEDNNTEMSEVITERKYFT
ncbi:polyribonucleotide nucleotidyltransferase [Rickettsia prowazekii]|uniref:Polyribonucleotide nucleotidyltransferase n=1 Tax=Rickettsia prowazekii (strain Rp22) TaxID=449216 RepID=D5AX93_RICPP|nr:polyribonucleotide nucleotidyltransferase [Rickettsia prowazekii]ADE30032.1 Polyribonucleotide nucleotidyltransferase [Rickettsia prowazekii str. Rp22]AFE49310.1 polynucleotide phosphorylase/polyadenylase [Rickettsia prowazekii str. Chernikova]AFE50155.1 polynucleotide phosphorylase/polyadenylase [Rickettsia prowazekii str. Katsinyian]AFE51001.1 polynucleotide phosphorylase/polyadenylase [Rickettsia prowazekii str. BuV67-CWPP]AFE51837.1 polynucleotide phosphorylase/polyadenylase [Rickettsia